MTPDNGTAGDVPVVPANRSPLHRAAGTGAMYVGPGDLYGFVRAAALSLTLK